MVHVNCAPNPARSGVVGAGLARVCGHTCALRAMLCVVVTRPVITCAAGTDAAEHYQQLAVRGTHLAVGHWVVPSQETVLSRKIICKKEKTALSKVLFM